MTQKSTDAASFKETNSIHENGSLSENMAAELGGLMALLMARRRPSEARPSQQKQEAKARASPQRAY